MASPTAPLAAFYEAAGSRNACYDYLDGYNGYVILSTGIYPTNTTGYYIQISDRYYHSPMFLMKYFAAVACNHVSAMDFAFLNVAPYLESAKREMIFQITGVAATSEEDLQGVTLNTIRMEYPHLPQTYCLLAMEIAQTAFNH